MCVELILSTLEEEAWMHKARGQSHSRTSPAIQVTCFPDAGSFPLPRVAFHLASIIHLSFSRWDRLLCCWHLAPLFLLFAFSSFFCSFTVASLLSLSAFKIKGRWIFLPILCMQIVLFPNLHPPTPPPQKKEHIAWGAHMRSNSYATDCAPRREWYLRSGSVECCS